MSVEARNTTLETQNTALDLRHPVLEDAWRLFGNYDTSSIKAGDKSRRLRLTILMLAVLATVAAIVRTVFSTKQSVWLELFDAPMQWLVIVLPLLVSIIQAGEARFKGGINYIWLRGSAEAIKSEIYRYRALYGSYASKQTQVESREIKLARKIKTISDQLMETEVNQAAIKVHNGPLPPYSESKEDDDGFSDLGPEQYLCVRLEDQLKRYHRKTREFERRIKRTHWAILFIGGLGTFLAAIGYEAWVAVTIAWASALASYLEFNQAERTLISYNRAAAGIEAVQIWWHAQPAAQRQANYGKLVENTERVLHTELAGWVQEMMESITSLYDEPDAAPNDAQP